MLEWLEPPMAGSLLSFDPMHRRNIPIRDLDRSGVVPFASTIDSVRFRSCAKKAFIRHAA
jgi:hypothetical protein